MMQKERAAKERVVIGWSEWVQLPLLHLPFIKAKVDTGARTSALHAFSVEPFTKKGAPWVRFQMHPLHGHADIIVPCEAPVIDRRLVTDSGGKGEKRLVIETFATMGDVTRAIEITLTNREKMAYRMLLGRQALERFGFIVDVKNSAMMGKVKPGAARKAYEGRAGVKNIKKVVS
jgi:hypothetical protein